MVLTQTGTLPSRTLKLYTRDPYNHISIGFDRNLDVLFSFGRKKLNNPLNGGFVQEGINKGLYSIFKGTICCVYKVEVTDEEFANLKLNIDKFNKEKEEILKKKKEKQEEKRNIFVSDAYKKAAIKKNEMIAKVETEIQQKLLVLKRELLKETMSALQERIREFTKTEMYKDFLFKLIEQSRNMLEDKNYILSLTEQDKEKYGDEIKKELSNNIKGNIEIKSSELDILGGLIIEEAEGNYRINNTLLSKLDDTKEYAGLLLTDLLG